VDPLRRLDAVEAAEGDVEHGDVGRRFGGEAHRLGGDAEAARDAQVRLRGEQRLQPVAHHGMVVEQEDADRHRRSR